MRPVHTFALVALVGCYSAAQPGPEYAGLSTGPAYPNENAGAWSGPPGGGIDPGYGYEDPSYPGYPAGYPDGGYPPGVDTGLVDPNLRPSPTGNAMGNVTDAEIDSTLGAYGEWIEVEEYGRVWRPYTTVVGADFTPYETCGTWIYTDYGWTFSCDEWNWGWLAFHFGRWAFVDDSWCWTRDYTWGPAWVDWRHGGGYVGWRPMPPTRKIRDHRDHRDGKQIRDHRRDPSSHWRFTTTGDFSRPGIRKHTMVNKDDAFRATEAVAHPPMRDQTRGRAADVMGGRFRGRTGDPTWNKGDRPTWQNHRPQNWGQTQPWQSNPVRTSPPNNSTHGWNTTSTTQPTRGQGNAWGNNPRPNRGANYNPPTRAWGNPGYTRPSPPTKAWGNTRPAPPSNAWGNTGYTRPAAPSRPPPSRPSPSWGGSRGSSASPPSRPSPSWGGSRGSSASPPSRPSPSSFGSRSSGSRSSGSYSSGSSRGSSSGSSRGSSSSSSRGSGGGKSRR